MDGVGKVDDGRSRGQIDDVAFRRKSEHLLGQQLAFDVPQQVTGVLALPLAFQKLAHPGDAVVQLIFRAHARLVFPVGRHAVFGGLVHLPGTDLHLKGNSLMSDDRRVQRLVHVGLGCGDIVLKAAGDGMVHVVDDAQRIVAFAHCVQNDAHRVHIVNFLKRAVLHIHLAVDAVYALDALFDGAFVHSVLGQALLDAVRNAADERIRAAVLGQERGDLLIAHRVQILQAAVLQLLLYIAHTQTVGNGSIHLHGFQRLVTAFLFGPAVAGAHVVQPVAQLDEHHAHILAHGKQHFAQVFSLLLLH